MGRATPNFSELQDDYERLLSQYRVTRTEDIKRASTRLLGFADRYKEVSDITGVPWEFIAVIHYRESNCDFTTHLHNGDSLKYRTRRVPAGRPKTGKPPFTWVESAVDALRQKGLDKLQDWSDARVAYELERYNGFGYRLYHGSVLSPYLWSGTSLYTRGKYVQDGKFSATTKDVQLGVIPLYFALKGSAPKVVTKEVVDSSRKLTILKRLRNAIVGTTSSILAMDWLGMLGQVKDFATDNAGVLIIGGVAVTWGVFKLIEQYSIQDYKEGRYIPSKESSQE